MAKKPKRTPTGEHAQQILDIVLHKVARAGQVVGRERDNTKRVEFRSMVLKSDGSLGLPYEHLVDVIEEILVMGGYDPKAAQEQSDRNRLAEKKTAQKKA